jgi:hypothetical protein
MRTCFIRSFRSKLFMSLLALGGNPNRSFGSPPPPARPTQTHQFKLHPAVTTLYPRSPLCSTIDLVC